MGAVHASGVAREGLRDDARERASIKGRMRRPSSMANLQDLTEFEEAPEEVRVTVANCDLAIYRGDIEGALKMLRKCAASPARPPAAR